MFLSCTNGTHRKTTKCKLFGTPLDDKENIQEILPDSRTLHHHYLDLATSVRTSIKNCETIRDLTKIVMDSFPELFDKIFIMCDTLLEFTMR